MSSLVELQTRKDEVKNTAGSRLIEVDSIFGNKSEVHETGKFLSSNSEMIKNTVDQRCN